MPMETSPEFTSPTSFDGRLAPEDTMPRGCLPARLMATLDEWREVSAAMIHGPGHLIKEPRCHRPRSSINCPRSGP